MNNNSYDAAITISPFMLLNVKEIFIYFFTFNCKNILQGFDWKVRLIGIFKILSKRFLAIVLVQFSWQMGFKFLCIHFVLLMKAKNTKYFKTERNPIVKWYLCCLPCHSFIYVKPQGHCFHFRSIHPFVVFGQLKYLLNLFVQYIYYFIIHYALMFKWMSNNKIN